MRETIYNYDLLKDEDITKTVIRIKALIIKDGKLRIGNEDNTYQFIGGHLEKGETFIECLKREVREESGIVLDDSEITGPFMKVTFLTKDNPEVGQNRKDEIYYYAVKTNKNVDLNNTNYTDDEILHHYKIEEFNLYEAADKIRENIPKNEMNKVISPDMIDAVNEYIKQSEG